jgi:hypothetical protein
MEAWAENQEEHWEKWADSYSEHWEDWAEKLESGEFDPKELNELLENNLEMLGEMPLGDMIEGALKEGLGELENAPFESLGELSELVGGALEQSLEKMEHELSGVAASEMRAKLSGLKTNELKNALHHLRHALDAKQTEMDKNAAEHIHELDKLMKKDGEWELSKRNAAEARELADLKMMAEKVAQQRKTVEKQARAMAQDRKALQAVAEAQLQAQLAKKNQLQGKKKQEVFEETIRTLYEDLKEEKEELSQKKSEIESMRREIELLRKEVERMKKGSGK